MSRVGHESWLGIIYTMEREVLLMGKKIQIFIDDESGDVTITISGFEEKHCLEITKQLDRYFGVPLASLLGGQTHS
jgi:hypothetical protein